MEFARRELEKYGWSDGRGLGKNEDGISKAIKPKLKFDNAGLGHNIADEFKSEWWRKLYDEAARNLNTGKQNDKIILTAEKETSDVKVKKNKMKNRRLLSMSKNYAGFIRTSELNGFRENSCNDIPSYNTSTENQDLLQEEELFKICGGRTAHKGARHGLKMSAKLARIEEQEKLMKSTESFVNNVNKTNRIKVKKYEKKSKLYA